MKKGMSVAALTLGIVGAVVSTCGIVLAGVSLGKCENHKKGKIV